MSRRWLDRWFRDREKENVLSMVREHLELTKIAVEKLYNMVRSASEAKSKKAELYERIAEAEMRADQLRRDMVKALTERDVSPLDREDLMELVRAADWVADWARESGRILAIIPFDDAPEELKRAARDMCRADYDCVKLLAECVNILPQDSYEAINLANEVEILEEEIDELYSVARGQLARLEFQGFSGGSLILLNEFLDSLETVADWCENTVDIVRSIVVRI